MHIPTVVRAEAITGMKQQLLLFILVLNNNAIITLEKVHWNGPYTGFCQLSQKVGKAVL